jgi:hypothetical protein
MKNTHIVFPMRSFFKALTSNDVNFDLDLQYNKEKIENIQI